MVRVPFTIVVLALCCVFTESIRFQPSCAIDIDECYFKPCEHGAMCVDGVNSYSCDCAPGYEGVHCENDIDDCAGVTCQSGGTCQDGVNSYTCVCVLGYDGPNCENNIDDCAGVTCQHGGTCQDGVNSYTCVCVLGYDGPNCENNIDDCAGVTCQSGGTCQDGVNSYTCTCALGYDGPNCENNINECIGVTCEHDGLCQDGVASYTCVCRPGYDGTHCENDIDECLAVKCPAERTCQDGVNSYTCNCPDGFAGAACEIDLAAERWRRESRTLWYKLMLTKLNYTEAEAACPTLGAGVRLAATGLRNPDIANSIASWMKSLGKALIWVGFKKVAGSWVWSDGGSGDIAWAGGEPNNSGACGQIWKTNPLGLDDHQCFREQIYLCEWETATVVTLP